MKSRTVLEHKDACILQHAVLQRNGVRAAIPPCSALEVTIEPCEAGQLENVVVTASSKATQLVGGMHAGAFALLHPAQPFHPATWRNAYATTPSHLAHKISYNSPCTSSCETVQTRCICFQADCRWGPTTSRSAPLLLHL